MVWSPSAVRRHWVHAAGALLVVSVGATAFACANLATVTLSTTAGPSGAVVTLTGASFASVQSAPDATPAPVVIHWRDDAGPVLAQAVPDRFGAITTSFTVPESAPGVYLVVATQVTERRSAGAAPDSAPIVSPVVGTPARIRFEVVSTPAFAVAGPASADGPQVASGELDPSIWFSLIASLAALALMLLGSGLVAFLYQARQSKLPADALWVPPGW